VDEQGCIVPRNADIELRPSPFALRSSYELIPKRFELGAMLCDIMQDRERGGAGGREPTRHLARQLPRNPEGDSQAL
jgi:hypothetical protein